MNIPIPNFASGVPMLLLILAIVVLVIGLFKAKFAFGIDGAVKMSAALAIIAASFKYVF